MAVFRALTWTLIPWTNAKSVRSCYLDATAALVLDADRNSPERPGILKSIVPTLGLHLTKFSANEFLPKLSSPKPQRKFGLSVYLPPLRKCWS